jgi:kinesin family protein 14
MYFPLHPGQNWVGPMVASCESSSIQLTGLMIENKHCCIDFSMELKIIANAETYVNGQLVGQSEVLLRHGDRLVIGGSHFFHLHNPRDSQFNEKYANNKVSY